MMPIVFIGSNFGLMISSLLPDAVLTIILTILLAYLTYENFNNAIKLFKLESDQQNLDPLL